MEPISITDDGRVISGDIAELRRFLRVPEGVEAHPLTMIAAIRVTQIALEDLVVREAIKAVAAGLDAKVSEDISGRAAATALRGLWLFMAATTPENLDDADEHPGKGYL